MRKSNGRLVTCWRADQVRPWFAENVIQYWVARNREGSADIAAAPDPLIEALRLSTRRPENARTIASLMHAIDRFRRPRPESVLTSAELAAITTPAIFILGSEDPYLSVERARTSIDQIQGARLYEVPSGHAPWLADAQHAAKLIGTHSHPGTRAAPHPGARVMPASKRVGLTGNPALALFQFRV